MLFTADRLTAQEAHRLGMVNEVVPLDELNDFALELARKIARQDLFSLVLAKRVVNQTTDIMGQPAALQAGFDLHEMGHAQCLARSAGESAVLTRDVAEMKKKGSGQ